VAKAAATLGMEHFFAGAPGRPEDGDYGDPMAGDGAADADAGDEGANDNAAWPGTGAPGRSAANGGAALVNINENTSAAPDGDAAGRGRIGAKPSE